MIGVNIYSCTIIDPVYYGFLSSLARFTNVLEFTVADYHILTTIYDE